MNMHMTTSGNSALGGPDRIAVFNNGLAFGNIAQGSLMPGRHIRYERQFSAIHHNGLPSAQRHERNGNGISRINL